MSDDSAQIGFAARHRCFWISAGRPSASFSPKSITTSRSVRPITKSMSCSTSSTVIPSAFSERSSAASSCFSRIAQAGRRLVQQQQHGVGRPARGRSRRCAACPAAGCPRRRTCGRPRPTRAMARAASALGARLFRAVERAAPRARCRWCRAGRRRARRCRAPSSAGSASRAGTCGRCRAARSRTAARRRSARRGRVRGPRSATARRR